MSLSIDNLDDLKDFLTHRLPGEIEKKDIFVEITSYYANFNDDGSITQPFVYTIQCSVPFIRYYIYFREKELAELGYKDAFRTLRTKIIDPILIQTLKDREALIRQTLDI